MKSKVNVRTKPKENIYFIFIYIGLFLVREDTIYGTWFVCINRFTIFKDINLKKLNKNSLFNKADLCFF